MTNNRIRKKAIHVRGAILLQIFNPVIIHQHHKPQLSGIHLSPFQSPGVNKLNFRYFIIIKSALNVCGLLWTELLHIIALMAATFFNIHVHNRNKCNQNVHNLEHSPWFRCPA